MSLPIPAGVACSYNGIVFPANIRTKVAEEPVLSGDNRNIKYSKITIDVSGYWTQDEADALVGAQAGAPLDALMQSIRLKLQANGKNLQYLNKGYGIDLNINQANNAGMRDVAMGPRADKFLFWSLGGAPAGCHGAGFNWSVSTCIPECAAARYTPGPSVFTEVYFTVSFDAGEDGLVTITTSGALSIPLSLQANNTLSDNVDSYFASVVANVPVGFLRRINRQLSADRATCTFTITDRQVETPFPNNVVHMEMKHSIKQNGITGTTWDAAITGTVRLSPTAPKNLAFARFFAIAFQRIELSRNRAGRGVGNTAKSNIMPPIWEMEEDLFKNESHFSLRYKILNCTLANIVANSGLWTQVVNAAYPVQDQWSASTWAASLAANAQAPKGILGATFSNQDEVLIDVCNYTVRVHGNRTFLGRPTLAIAPDDVVEDEEKQPSPSDIAKIEPINLMQQMPGPDGQLADQGESQYDPTTSWINWQCEVRPITDHRQVRHKPLSGTVNYIKPEVDPLESVVNAAENTADQTPGWNSTVPDIIQQISSPSMILELRGFGVRVAYRVQPPKLISFGGVTPVLVYEDTPESTLGMAGGVVVYRTDWVLRYMLPSAPKSIQLPANPFQGIDGDA